MFWQILRPDPDHQSYRSQFHHAPLARSDVQLHQDLSDPPPGPNSGKGSDELLTIDLQQLGDTTSNPGTSGSGKTQEPGPSNATATHHIGIV